MSIDLAQYKKLFLEESGNHLNLIKEKLKSLSVNNDDLISLKDLHRAVHSLKGESLAIGLTEIGLECQALENILRDQLESKQVFDSQKLKIIMSFVNKIETRLKEIS